jgi:hypothetical protein
VSDIAHLGLPTQATGSSITAKSLEYVTVCAAFEHSGHLKNHTSYCSSTGCLSVNSIVVLQTLQGPLEFM